MGVHHRDELLVFTDAQQCYKTRLSDLTTPRPVFWATICPPSWASDEGRASSGPASPGDYSGNLLFFFQKQQGRPGGLAATRLRPGEEAWGATRINPPCRGVPSAGGPGAGGDFHRGHLHDGFHTRRPSPQAPAPQGVNVMALKPKYSVETVKPLGDTPSSTSPATAPARVPIAGALLREEDRGGDR